MGRKPLLVGFSLCALVLVGADKDHDLLQGTWRATSVNLEGEEISKEQLATPNFRVTYIFNDDELAAWTGTDLGVWKVTIDGAGSQNTSICSTNSPKKAPSTTSGSASTS